VPDLRSLYGEHCAVDLISVAVFGHRFAFLRVGANALLRAAVAAYDTGYDVYRIGAYNCRSVTNGSTWSSHAWAAAVDINPDRNPYSSRNRLITNMPTTFVEAFTGNGFGWGGSWRSPKDPMHMSLAPSEGGAGIREPYDAELQARAEAKWAGRPAPIAPEPERPGIQAPQWEHEHQGSIARPHQACGTTRRWQQRMEDRGWEIDVDGLYGIDSEQVCRAFQREKDLTCDGILGPETWRCAWECAIT
jgi:peptidoglycan hydrolase-like protein with peptidoglycan-binding domain